MVYLVTENGSFHYGGSFAVRFASRSKEKAEKALKILAGPDNSRFKLVEIPMGEQDQELYRWEE